MQANTVDLGLNERKTREIRSRITPSDFEKIQYCADANGLKISDFIRLAAKKLIAEAEAKNDE